MQNWFCVRTEPRSEFLAKASIERLFPGEVYAPTFLARIAHARTVTHQPRLLFPRYIFVRFDLRGDQGTWECINSQRGVEYLISQDRKPIPIPRTQMDNLRAMVAEHNAAQHTKRKSPYRIGQTLRVVTGPFTSYSGICEMAEIDRVKILMRFLGGSCCVEVAPTCVEAVA